LPDTFTPTSATVHALKYLATNVAAGPVAIRTRAQLIADSMMGQLRAVLLAANTAALWVALPDGALLSVYLTPRWSGGGIPFNSLLTFDGPTMTLRLVAAGAFDPNSCCVELRINHSLCR
jgi:hypothetical protein